MVYLPTSSSRDPGSPSENGCLGFIGDYTTQLCGDYNTPSHRIHAGGPPKIGGKRYPQIIHLFSDF